MTVRTLTLGDDPQQVLQDINAAFDGTTQTDLKARTLVCNADQDIGDYNFRAKTFQSDVPNGTPPLIIASTTEVANLKSAMATLADAAKGDTRFQISGNVYATSAITINSGTSKSMQNVHCNIPSGKSLILKSVRYRLNNVNHRFKITMGIGGTSWVSNDYENEVLNINQVINTGPISLYSIQIQVYNPSLTNQDILSDSAIGWWADLAIE
jgi:hypothetical protein